MTTEQPQRDPLPPADPAGAARNEPSIGASLRYWWARFIITRLMLWLCPPRRKPVRTVKSGDWGDPSVWEGGALTSNPHHIRVDDMGALEEAKQTSALLDLCESAWGIIANASEGNWEREHPTWREAAAQWRERYHRVLIPPLTAPRVGATNEENR
jgi:hypothetical protein